MEHTDPQAFYLNLYDDYEIQCIAKAAGDPSDQVTSTLGDAFLRG
jgi:hypothetical protein